MKLAPFCNSDLGVNHHGAGIKDCWVTPSNYSGAAVFLLPLQGVTNRAPLEPVNRGLMEPLKGVVLRVPDGVIFGDFSEFSKPLRTP